MAVTKTAKRALRQAENKRDGNNIANKAMKLQVKEIRNLIIEKEIQRAKSKLSTTFQAIDKAVKRGIVKKGNANRKKSRLYKAISKLEK